MKYHFRILFLALAWCKPDIGISQDIDSEVFNATAKGKLFITWGYNRSFYTKSDISFAGQGYDFVLKNVVGTDRQTPFDPMVYFNPAMFTHPQYNLIIGYYLKDGLSISLNIDHMKYVMLNDQTAAISGYIDKQSPEYDGTYESEPIVLAPEFLYFEHTDGLNYSNIELTKHFRFWLSKSNNFSLTGHAGIAAGTLIPKSNVLFLGEGTDQFHLAGFGTSVVGGIMFTFYKRWVFRYEVKGGYINMPDIVINGSKSADRARQDFWFLERFFTVGAAFPIRKND